MVVSSAAALYVRPVGVGVDLLELETPDRLDGRPSLFGGVVVNSQLPYHSRWTG